MLARRLPHGSRVLAPIALLATLLLLAAGCGGAGSSSPTRTEGPDPATLAPADALAYVEAIVRPSGDMKAGVVAAARKVLRVQDPGAELRRLVDKALRSNSALPDASYARDVEPWIGDRVGIAVVPSSGRGGPDIALIAATRDRAALQRELARMRRGGDTRAGGTYRGVAYDLDSGSSNPTAAVGDFLVLASSLSALRASVDAMEGDSLARASDFQDARGAAPDAALAFAYADPKAIVAAVERAPDVPPAAHGLLAGFRDAGPVVASLTASADEIAIEGSGTSRLLGTVGSSDAEVTIGQLPGDAWLALATPPIGPLVRSVLDAAGVHDRAAAQVRAKLGLDLDRDLLDGLGGLGLFVRGASPLDLGGGVLLQMTSAAAAQRLLTRVEAIVGAGLGTTARPVSLAGARGFEVAIPQSPQPIVVLAKGDKLAAGYAASSAQDLLAPQQRLDESSAGKAAIATLGDGYTPSLVLVVPPLAALLRSLDELQVADLSSVLPYVSAYRSLAIGTKRDGDRTSVRIVASLR